MKRFSLSYRASSTAIVLPQPSLEVLDHARGEILGYIAIWGSPDQRDSYDTWFDKERPPEMGLDFLPIPLMYEHADDSVIRKDIVGRIYKVFFDSAGIGFRAILDRGSRHFKRILSEVVSGVLKTSSGSSPHLADFDDDGRFVSWLLAEVSLTKTPAEDRMPAVVLVRSVKGGPKPGKVSPGQPRQKSNSISEDPPMKKTAARQKQSRRKASNSPIRATLQELLKEENVNASPEEILAALVEEYGVEAIMDLIAQMSGPVEEMSAPEADEARDVEDPAAEADASELQGSGEALPPDLVEAFKKLLALAGRSKKPSKRRHVPDDDDDDDDELDRRVRALERQARREQSQSRSQQHAAPNDLYPIAPRGTGSRIEVMSRFDGMTPEQMALGYILLEANQPRALRGRMSPVSQEYLKEMTYKTAVGIERGDSELNDPEIRKNFVRKDGRAIRANEVMQTDDAGVGLEWVKDLQGTTMWETIRQNTPVWDRAIALGMDNAEIPQGYNAETIPLEGADPSWYVAPGTTDIDTSSGMATPTFATSKIGTGEKAVNVAKLSVAMVFQQELVEDSIVPIVQEAQRKIQVTSAEQIEMILLRGDVTLTANSNINLIDGTPASAPTRPAYTLLDGWAHLPLVVNTANARDAGATLDEDDYLLLLPLLGPEGKYATDLDRVMFVVDNSTYFASLRIAALKTHDVFTNATIENGVLTRIWGIEVLRSAQLGKANTNGMISGTGSNNTKGRILLVRPDQWVSRWKRRLQTDVTYFAYQDVTQVVAHMRWGIAYRDNEAAALSYNVAV